MGKLSIRNLTKSYGDHTVVNKVNIEVEDSQLLTIVGPSGCGKTTILRMIAGFIEPTGGQIYLDDKLLVDVENHVAPVVPEKRNVGMVFQSYAVWPHMKVFDNVAYPLKLRKTAKDVIQSEVMRVLKVVHLEGLENRMAHELSGGQQQRVALARALIMKPKLLLLDEPLSNLDAALREEMRGEIKEIQRTQHITIINVTHDQIEAMTMSDKVAVVKKGVLEQFAPPYELYENPVNTFVAKFIGSANILPATRKADAKRDKNGMMDILVAGCYPMKVPYVNTTKETGFAAVRAHHMAPDEASPFQAHIRRALYQGSQIEYYLEAPGCEMFRLLSSVDFIKPEGADITVNIQKAVWLDE
jgi:iron(III) transport system ATP-binding protein